MANTCVIKRDPGSQQMTITVVDASGAIVATYGSCTLSLSHLGGRHAYFQAIPYKRASDCTWKQRYFLCTDEEAYTPP